MHIQDMKDPMMRKLKDLLGEPYSLLPLLLAVESILVLRISLGRLFNCDEIEATHSAWYMLHKFVPYVDYFQQHNPLLSVILTPFLAVCGETAAILIVLRILFLFFTFGIALLVYLIARETEQPRGIALFSAALLLSVEMFVMHSIEIRPDVPQVFFELISTYFFLRHIRTGRNRLIAVSGFCAAISFLFIQKAVFFLCALGLVLIFCLIKRSLRIKSVLYFGAGFLPPVAIFGCYLLLSKSLDDYLLTCWLLNMQPQAHFSPIVKFSPSLKDNFIFWAAGLTTAALTLLRPGIRRPGKSLHL